MSHIRRVVSVPRLIALIGACVLIFSLNVPAQAASQQALFNSALKEFKYVLKSPTRAARRDLWLTVHERFDRVLRAGTTTGYAPKSLYYMGRCYEELVSRSGLRKDAHRAVDYFQRAVNRFPRGNSWIDDCLYRKAEITFVRLGDGGTAARDLRLILSKYSKGDHAAKAKALLARIKGKPAPKVIAKTPPRQASSVAAKPTSQAPSYAPLPQSTAPKNIRKAYDRAVNDFKSLRANSATQRRQFTKLADRFRRLFHASPRSVIGARSAYFVGVTFEELGERSGRQEDFETAASYYGRASDLFRRTDSWRDDALFRKASITYKRLGKEDQAYADLLLIVDQYPKGDQAQPAKDLMHQMDQASAGQLPKSKPEAVAVTPTKTPRPVNGTFGGATGAAKLLGVRYHTGDDFTRIVLDLDNAVKFTEAALPADPAKGKQHRMFIDLERTSLAPSVQTKVDVTKGFLRSIRAGQYTPGSARVVLDFNERQEYHIFTLENPHRIVVDVFAHKTVPGKGAPAEVAKADPPRKPGYKEKTTAKDVLAQLGMTIRTVMIDAGHGGRDPGALQYIKVRDSRGKLKKKIRTKEKDVTLRLAKILGRNLESRGFNVLYTRSKDKKVHLEDRALAANIKKADLFISLHCNANRSSKVSGFETYYLGKARNDIVLKLAAKENNVDPMKISDTQKIVMDLVHSFKIEESKVLAKYVQKSCVKRVKGKYKTVNDHGSRSAPFYVLIGAKMPAVLVEAGYLTNKTEAGRLRSEAYLETVADGITDGIEAYRRELRSAGL